MGPESNGCRIRPLQSSDSFEGITALLHRSYKELGDAGMNFTAVDQKVKQTEDRCLTGLTLVVEDEAQQIVGIGSLYPSSPKHDVHYYRVQSRCYFGQFGIDPCHRRKGLGITLLQELERAATQLGFAEIALDTAEPANRLVNYYQVAGYEVCDQHQWHGKVYSSWIMRKPLPQAAGAKTPVSFFQSSRFAGALLGTQFCHVALSMHDVFQHCITQDILYHPDGWDTPMAQDIFRYCENPHSIPRSTPEAIGTPFQQEVWATLGQIPAGQTRTYAELAMQLGKPEAIRAVAAAIGQNPLAILIPCHRVIGSDGDLTGYRWGLEVKRRLLEWEGAASQTRFEF